MVDVRLIGSASMEADRPGRVLAWLALHPGLHDRGTVAAQLWPEILDGSARASLRSALWELRKLLGDDGAGGLRATRDQVGLADEPVLRVDVRRARELAAAGRDDEALAIADGELLPGFPDDWATEARDEHRAFVVDLLGRVARAAADSDELGRAIELAQRRCTLEPLSEELHRDLLRLLARAGDRAAALAAHARMRRLLLETLGVGPSAETRALVDELRAEADGAPPGLPTRLRRMELEPFVGREPELRSFAGAWRRALAGRRPQLVLLAGEPGIGKTRLAARFAAVVDTAGGAVLYGGAFEDSLAPLEPFAEALSATPDGSSRDAANRVAAMFEQVETEVQARAGDGAALLVLDDMQWADHLTATLLAHLVRAPLGDRLLVLCVYREAELAGSALMRVLPSLRRECDVEDITLRGLRGADVRALIEQGPEADAASDQAALISRRSAGNPLFARELARELASGGSLEGAVPPAVGELIARRTARLADGGETIAAAAVLGESFSPQVLALTLGHAAADALDEAVAAKLLEETDSGLRFTHALVRAALYARVGPARRAELHARAAEALVAARGEDAWPEVVEVARHTLAATAGQGDPEAAIDLAARAAARATDAAAFDQAVELYTRALGLTASDDPRRRELTIRRASVFQLLTHVVIDAPQLVG